MRGLLAKHYSAERHAFGATKGSIHTIILKSCLGAPFPFKNAGSATFEGI